MYHPTRGGVRGGRDQFKWDDVKVDKHRENYLGHSIMAPVGRWQKGKDLHWYARDKKSAQDEEAAKEEIRRIKEQEEQAMREALGLAPKSSSRSHGNRLDKHEFQELVKKGSTAEDLGEGHADAVQVHGLGFARAPRAWEDPSTLPSNTKELVQILPEKVDPVPPASTMTSEAKSNDEINSNKRNREEKRTGKDHKSRHSRESDDRKKHKKDKEKRRHESDYARDDRKKHKKDRDRRRHDSD